MSSGGSNEVRGVGKSEPPKRKFRFRSVTVGRRENKKTARPKLQCFQRFPGEQPSISYKRHQKVVPFLIILMVELLQVDYQSKKVSPFDTHPINMWVSIGAACIFGVGIAWELRNHPTTYSKIINRVILSLGALAPITLAMVLVSRLVGWLMLCIWIILPVILVRHLLKHIYEWLKYNIYNTITVSRVRFNKLWECLSSKKQHLPTTITVQILV